MGTLEMVQGDLFTADTDAIAHGCNCRGRMGAGIAAPMRQKFPDMFGYYERLCDERLFSAGSVMAWIDTGAAGHDFDDYPFRCIYNLGTQLAPGASAEPRFISIVFKHMADRMWKNGHESVAIPLIGCGIGGLSWHHDVRPFAQNLAERVNVKVYYLNPKDLN